MNFSEIFKVYKSYKNVNRTMEYAGMDCYAYCAKCSCGWKNNEWHIVDSERAITKHFFVDHIGITKKDFEENKEEMIEQFNGELIENGLYYG